MHNNFRNDDMVYNLYTFLKLMSTCIEFCGNPKKKNKKPEGKF